MKLKKYISYTLLVIWCLVIFYLSSQTSDVSGSNSLNVLNHLFGWLDSKNLVGFNPGFREFMHSGVYFVLGILAYSSFKNSCTKVFTYSLLFCVFYSLSDEIHQLFVSGRAFELIDLTLDFIGSLLGIYIVKLLERMWVND